MMMTMTTIMMNIDAGGVDLDEHGRSDVGDALKVIYKTA